MMTPGEASQRANAMAAVAAASGLYVPRNREDESMVLGRSKKASQRIGLYEWLQLIRDLGWPCEQDVFETRLDAWDLEHEVTPTLDSAEGVDSEGTEE